MELDRLFGSVSTYTQQLAAEGGGGGGGAGSFDVADVLGDAEAVELWGGAFGRSAVYVSWTAFIAAVRSWASKGNIATIGEDAAAALQAVLDSAHAGVVTAHQVGAFLQVRGAAARLPLSGHESMP